MATGDTVELAASRVQINLLRGAATMDTATFVGAAVVVVVVAVSRGRTKSAADL